MNDDVCVIRRVVQNIEVYKNKLPERGKRNKSV